MTAYFEVAESMRLELGKLWEEGHDDVKEGKGLDIMNALDLEMDRVTVYRKYNSKQYTIKGVLIKPEAEYRVHKITINCGASTKY